MNSLGRMKSSAWLCLSTILFAGLTGWASSSDEPVLHYDFEQVEGTRVTDNSGNGRHGYIDSTNSYKPEKVPGGLRFKGAKNCVMVFNVDSMNVGEGGFAIEMVFELDPEVPYAVAEEEFPVLISADYGNQRRAIEVYIGGEGYIWFLVRDPSGGWGASRSDEPVVLGEPVHLVAVLDKDTRWDTMKRELYLNGVLQRDVDRGAALSLNGNRRFTLAAEESGKRHLQGILRDFRLYARPLSGEEDPILQRGRALGKTN